MAQKPAFDQKLAEVWSELAEMGRLVKTNLEMGKKAFETSDTVLAEKVIESDNPINKSEIRLEDKLITLIALDHPVATDLRKIVAAFKIISHLERLGDHAVHWAKATIRNDGDLPRDYLDHFDIMLAQVLKMLDQALESFMNLSVEQARTVASFDNLVDEENQKVLARLFNADDKLTTREISVILTLARYLERAGDHISHICEWVVYAVENKHVELNS